MKRDVFAFITILVFGVGMLLGIHARSFGYDNLLDKDLPTIRGAVEQCEKPLPRTEKCVVIVEVKPESISKEM